MQLPDRGANATAQLPVLPPRGCRLVCRLVHAAPTPPAQEAKRGLGTSAVFIARNRFAVLDKASSTIQIRNLQNEITKKAPPPCATTDAIFYAGTGMLLCRSEDKVGRSGRVCVWGGGGGGTWVLA